MKVYVLTTGEYSDYCILGVVLDREQAEYIASVMNKRVMHIWGDPVTIEEYDTDVYSCIKKNTKPYYVVFSEKDHGVLRICPTTWGMIPEECRYNSYDNTYSVYTIAENEESAVKSASDRLAKYLAEQNEL